jgi:hypothetical protein
MCDWFDLIVDSTEIVDCSKNNRDRSRCSCCNNTGLMRNLREVRVQTKGHALLPRIT